MYIHYYSPFFLKGRLRNQSNLILGISPPSIRVIVSIQRSAGLLCWGGTIQVGGPDYHCRD